MIKINPKEHRHYLSYFKCFDYVIAVEGFLLGHSKGELYVDDCDKPELLVIWNTFDGFYISLQSEKKIELARQWIEQLTQEAIHENQEFVIYVDEKYSHRIEALVPIEDYRPLNVLLYSSEEGVPYKTLEINEPYGMLKDLRKVHEYADGEEIMDVIDTTWSDIEAFFKYGEYAVMVDQLNQRIAGYCISEHITKAGIEFSIEVMEDYRKQGIGEILGQKLLKTCSEYGKKPYWYCTDDNKASIHLAEKLGLKLTKAFRVWFFEMS